jgi:hypothetical protein
MTQQEIDDWLKNVDGAAKFFKFHPLPLLGISIHLKKDKGAEIKRHPLRPAQ